jgi:hypothetical protein
LLLNDGKLYAGLVDVARELKGTTTDLQRLIDQWEQDGLSLNLGKK